MITLLAELSDVGVAQIMQWLRGKLSLRAFRLLKAKHVRLQLVQDPLNQTNTQANRVDIPCSYLECHAASMSIGPSKKASSLFRIFLLTIDFHDKKLRINLHA